MYTRTGHFPIGFRRGGSAWQKDTAGLIAWMQENDLSVIDLSSGAAQEGRSFMDADIRLGSVDLADTRGMLSADAGRRREAVARNTDQVRANAALGPLNYFLVMLPEDPARPRAENFDYMVQSFGELLPVLEQNQARLSIEGWPGPGALCCTPEGFRALFHELPSMAVGINYDPSHLIRMGIDPLRFLGEWAERVAHVHGKDTELLAENLYEYGHELPAIFARPFAFGGMAWRYTLPGHGVMRWSQAFRILQERGYTGCVSIELEDAFFNGAEDSEKLGILQGALFLRGC